MCVALSSQIAGGKVNILEQNSIRYCMTFLMSSVLVIIHRTSVFVQAKYIHKIIFIGVFDLFLTNILFFAESFMPIGSNDAMFVGLHYISSTIIDLCEKKIKFWSALASLVILVGLISMAQPWNKTAESVDICQVPCDYWENRMYDAITYNISEEPETLHHRFLKEFCKNQSNNNCTIKEDINFIYIDGVKHEISIHPFILGYIVVIIAAITATIRAYITKDLRRYIESQTLLFWLGCFESILAILLTIIWSTATGVPIYSFPSGKICLIFFVCYPFFAGVLYIAWVYSAGYLNISKLALARVVSLLVLYVCQRTFLKHFHPGKANLFEMFGVAIILCGLLVTFCEVILPCLKNENK